MEPLPAVAWLRLAVALVAVTWISWGPVTHQVLGHPTQPLSRTWQMYGKRGIGLCDVRYWHRTDRGDIPLDRYALLGTTRWTADYYTRFLWRPEAVEKMGRRLCGRLPRGERDVRADARCATRDDWRPEFSREDNLCQPERRR